MTIYELSYSYIFSHKLNLPQSYLVSRQSEINDIIKMYDLQMTIYELSKSEIFSQKSNPPQSYLVPRQS